jgi:hypothetical protein
MGNRGNLGALLDIERVWTVVAAEHLSKTERQGFRERNMTQAANPYKRSDTERRRRKSRES